jgi:hypothetical protein
LIFSEAKFVFDFMIKAKQSEANFYLTFFLQSSFPQVQLANGQPQLMPILTSNGYHHQHQASLNGHQQQRHHHQSLQQPQYQTAYLTDPNSLLHHHHTMSPGAAAASANGLLPPQQRTDRLQVFDTKLTAQNFLDFSLNPYTRRVSSPTDHDVYIFIFFSRTTRLM